MDGAHRTSSRRAFLARTAVVAAAPLLARCGRRRPTGRGQGDTTASDGAVPPPARPAPPDTEPVMRVRVLAARGADAGVALGEGRQWLRVGAAAAGSAENVVRGPIDVQAAKRRWLVLDANGNRIEVDGEADLAVATLLEDPERIRLGRRLYPGSLRLRRTGQEGTGLDVINLVAMEAYLPGVVAGELFEHWKYETRAAQAVAARSFAACEHAWYRSRRAWDVTATARSQVYLGVIDHAPTLRAVEATRGVMLAYGGLLVPGYYSACCGGLAASALDAIGPNPVNDAPPLHGRSGPDVCTGVGVARWTIERDVRDLAKRLAAWGASRRAEPLAELRTVKTIETIERNVHGRPTRYAITGRRGRRAELSAEALRIAANFSGDELDPPDSPVWSSHLAVRIDGATAFIEGRGYGHGAGLCQYGAEQLARAGRAHDEILEWYYPGAELAGAYRG